MRHEREDNITTGIERQTSKVPSVGFLAAAIGSIGASAILKMLGKNDASHFVGQWAPTFLILGVYNKLAKQRFSTESSGS